LPWSLDSLTATPGPGLAAVACAAALYAVGRVGRYYFRRLSRRRWAAQQRSIRHLNRITWQEFELLTAEMFRRYGYRVTVTGGGGADNGVDLLLFKNGRRTVVQIKQYKHKARKSDGKMIPKKIGVKAIREAVGVARDHNTDSVCFVALGGFGPKAIEYAKRNRILLIDGPALLKLLHRQPTR